MKKGDSASFCKTISEFDVYQFAGIVGDFNSIHINKLYADNSMFKARIAHGMLISSFISTVIGVKLPGEGTIYMEQDSKFLAPVKIGDTITAVVTVLEYINKDKGIVKLLTQVFNQDEKLVVDGYAIVKVDARILEGWLWRILSFLGQLILEDY